MKEQLCVTTSVCAECGRFVTARVEQRDDGVWFEKHCQEHGAQAVRVSGTADDYRRVSIELTGSRSDARKGWTSAMVDPPRHSSALDYRFWPDAPDFCPVDGRSIALPILEITEFCDLTCPACFKVIRHRHLTREEVARSLDRLIARQGTVDLLTLAGGEPTLNPDFLAIVEECVSRPQISGVCVRTHGRTLCRRPTWLEFLANRQVLVSLQFDGRCEGPYQVLRARPLLEEKLELIVECSEYEVPMMLGATIVPGVNDGEVPGIARLLFEHAHILAVSFQPAPRLRQAAWMPELAGGQVTAQDLIARLAGCVHADVRPGDFQALPGLHPACAIAAQYEATSDGRFHALREPPSVPVLFGLPPAPVRPESRLRWADASQADGEAATIAAWWDTIPAERLVRSADETKPKPQTRKTILLHHLMDWDTFDLERARRCGQAVVRPDGQIICGCAYNCFCR